MVSRDNRIEEIDSLVERAQELFEDLEVAYNRDLEAKEVSKKAKNLTHEVLEKCSNILDQTMTICFELDIRPHLTELPK
ncbi:hypothetical protein, partial [Cognatishimia sp.]|uniref:hypothetical protein n=1 Tax=Cognatishimia sp. TaxID=2211648 RepID=UPI0035176B88